MLTDDKVTNLLILLKKLEKRNIGWKLECMYDGSFIIAFKARFHFSKRDINKLDRYIRTYDMHRIENSKCEKEKSSDKPTSSYDIMVEDALADLKAKCGLRNELMSKLFNVLKQDLTKNDPNE